MAILYIRLELIKEAAQTYNERVKILEEKYINNKKGFDFISFFGCSTAAVLMQGQQLHAVKLSGISTELNMYISFVDILVLLTFQLW